MELKEIANPPEMKTFKHKFEELLSGDDVGFMMGFAEMMLLLHRVVVVSDAYFQKMGTSKGRFLVLVRLLLSDSPAGESISSLRPFYPISYAAMSGVLDTLEKDSMIERCANPEDRRKVNIRLTDKGRNFINEFLPVHLNNVKKVGSGLQENEIEQLFGSMKKIIGGFERLINSLPEEHCKKSTGRKKK
ncbi:MAG: MarR family transcriptional regulator [Desulfotalea sp.]